MSKFVRLNLAIIPNNEVSEAAINTAAQITDNHQSYFGVDRKHYFPHITIYPPEYPEQNIESVIRAVDSIVSMQSTITVQFGEVSSHWGYIDVEVVLNTQLIQLHQQIVEQLNPLREGRVREKYQDPSNLTQFSQSQREMLFQYGYADCLDLYRPHLTFARSEDEQSAQLIAKSLVWPISTMQITSLGIFLSLVNMGLV